MKILGMDGKPIDRDPKNDPVTITRHDFDTLCDNALEYNRLFRMIEKRLQKLECQAPDRKPLWQWWRR